MIHRATRHPGFRRSMSIAGITTHSRQRQRPMAAVGGMERPQSRQGRTRKAPIWQKNQRRNGHRHHPYGRVMRRKLSATLGAVGSGTVSKLKGTPSEPVIDASSTSVGEMAHLLEYSLKLTKKATGQYGTEAARGNGTQSKAEEVKSLSDSNDTIDKHHLGAERLRQTEQIVPDQATLATLEPLDLCTQPMFASLLKKSTKASSVPVPSAASQGTSTQSKKASSTVSLVSASESSLHESQSEQSDRCLDTLWMTGDFSSDDTSDPRIWAPSFDDITNLWSCLYRASRSTQLSYLQTDGKLTDTDDEEHSDIDLSGTAHSRDVPLRMRKQATLILLPETNPGSSRTHTITTTTNNNNDDDEDGALVCLPSWMNSPYQPEDSLNYPLASEYRGLLTPKEPVFCCWVCGSPLERPEMGDVSLWQDIADHLRDVSDTEGMALPPSALADTVELFCPHCNRGDVPFDIDSVLDG